MVTGDIRIAPDRSKTGAPAASRGDCNIYLDNELQLNPTRQRSHPFWLSVVLLQARGGLRQCFV